MNISCILVWVGRTKYRKLCGLSTTEVYFSQSRRLEPEFRVPAWLGAGEDPPSCGLQMAAFSLCPHVVERALASALASYKGANPVHEVPTLTT